jgi:hypothetical protein
MSRKTKKDIEIEAYMFRLGILKSIQPERASNPWETLPIPMLRRVMPIMTQEVNAEAIQLRTRWSVETAQDLRAVHSINMEEALADMHVEINAEDAMADAVSQQMADTIDRELLEELFTLA